MTDTPPRKKLYEPFIRPSEAHGRRLFEYEFEYYVRAYGLNRTQMSLLHALYLRTDIKDRQCQPSQSELAEIMGIDRTNVCRALRQLMELKIVKQVEKGSSFGNASILEITRPREDEPEELGVFPGDLDYRDKDGAVDRDIKRAVTHANNCYLPDDTDGRIARALKSTSLEKTDGAVARANRSMNAAWRQCGVTCPTCRSRLVAMGMPWNKKAMDFLREQWAGPLCGSRGELLPLHANIIARNPMRAVPEEDKEIPFTKEEEELFEQVEENLKGDPEWKRLQIRLYYGDDEEAMEKAAVAKMLETPFRDE